MRWKLLWQIERLCMWIGADSHPRREKVWHSIMWWSGAVLLLWSVHLAWTALTPAPQINFPRYWGAAGAASAARFFAELASLFRDPDDDRRGGPPEAPPAPWPQSPDLIVLDLAIQEREEVQC